MQHKLRSLIKKRKESTKKNRIFLIGSIAFVTITLLIIIAITVIFGIWLQDKINVKQDQILPMKFNLDISKRAVRYFMIAVENNLAQMRKAHALHAFPKESKNSKSGNFKGKQNKRSKG